MRAVEESMLAGEWLLQPELSERTSSLLPAFVESTSYCEQYNWALGRGWTGNKAGWGKYYLHVTENEKGEKLD